MHTPSLYVTLFSCVDDDLLKNRACSYQDLVYSILFIVVNDYVSVIPLGKPQGFRAHNFHFVSPGGEYLWPRAQSGKRFSAPG